MSHSNGNNSYSSSESDTEDSVPGLYHNLCPVCSGIRRKTFVGDCIDSRLTAVILWRSSPLYSHPCRSCFIIAAQLSGSSLTAASAAWNLIQIDRNTIPVHGSRGPDTNRRVSDSISGKFRTAVRSGDFSEVTGLVHAVVSASPSVANFKTLYYINSFLNAVHSTIFWKNNFDCSEYIAYQHVLKHRYIWGRLRRRVGDRLAVLSRHGRMVDPHKFSCSKFTLSGHSNPYSYSPQTELDTGLHVDMVIARAWPRLVVSAADVVERLGVMVADLHALSRRVRNRRMHALTGNIINMNALKHLVIHLSTYILIYTQHLRHMGITHITSDANTETNMTEMVEGTFVIHDLVFPYKVFVTQGVGSTGWVPIGSHVVLCDVISVFSHLRTLSLHCGERISLVEVGSTVGYPIYPGPDPQLNVTSRHILHLLTTPMDQVFLKHTQIDISTIVKMDTAMTNPMGATATMNVMPSWVNTTASYLDCAYHLAPFALAAGFGGYGAYTNRATLRAIATQPANWPRNAWSGVKNAGRWSIRDLDKGRRWMTGVFTGVRPERPNFLRYNSMRLLPRAAPQYEVELVNIRLQALVAKLEGAGMRTITEQQLQNMADSIVVVRPVQDAGLFN
ncbi:hypothetical protein QAD02_022098 [Eretmocerus hayati]|uniref:Uncharacterized protein n=1 Tax=Eretmocerus hayati TaxID=131215 RepID=A0ACC2PRT3_9HYME|nr:hypothetical protein QAD02_022098 [Eretmocerus hayati]